jgi:hypothetical protein
MRRIVVLLFLVALLALAGSALAMSSDNFRLDWFTPLTGGGGGTASSPNHAVNLTVGQSVIGLSAGEGYQACLGYWCGSQWQGAPAHSIFLPLVIKD